MFTSNPPTTKRRTPHGSFSRSSQIPLPSTSISNNSLVVPTNNQQESNSDVEEEEDGIQIDDRNNNSNNHEPLSIESSAVSSGMVDQVIVGTSNNVNQRRSSIPSSSNESRLPIAIKNNNRSSITNNNKNNNYPNGTSVNIATAFTQALVNNNNSSNTINGIGSSKDREKEMNNRRNEMLLDEVVVEEGDEGSGKDTQNTSITGDGISKKRKKRTSKDMTSKDQINESDNEWDMVEEVSRNKIKRSKKEVEIEVEIIQDSPKRTSPSTRRKTSDPTYRPEISFSPSNQKDNEIEISSSSSSEDDRSKRRKSKGKSTRRTSGGRGSSRESSQAIPIGRRDSEVWMGKKKKSKKSSTSSRGKSNDSGNGSREESRSESIMSGEGMELGEVEEGAGEGEGEDMGGFDYQPDQDQQFEDNPTPVASSSYFLRPKSVSPSPSVSISPERQRTSFSPQSNRFNFRSASREPQPSRLNPEIDPTFAVFDRSLNDKNPLDLSNSFDESGVRGSSYDYSEEERIVAAIEAEKLREREREVSEVPSTSNITITSSGMRRRRNKVPSPPTLRNEMEPIEEEEIIIEEPKERKRSVGNKLGEIIMPVLRSGRSIWRILNDPTLDWFKIWRAIGLALAGLFLISLLTRQPTTTSNSSLGKSLVDFIPFFSSRSSSTPSYSAPELPAESFDILVKRLSLLESTMGQLTSKADSERIKSSKDRIKLDSIDDRFIELRDNIDRNKEELKRSIESSSSHNMKDSQGSMNQIKSDLANLVSRVKSLSEDRTIDNSAIKVLQSRINSVEQDVVSLGSKVTQIAKELQVGIESDRISKIALEAIGNYLPSKLAVRMDSNGKLEIDPKFWKSLKEAFVEKKGMDSIINSRISSEIAKLPSSSNTQSSNIVSQQPSWQEFLNSNEESLKSWIDSDIKGRLGSDAIISKKAFLDILHREIKNLKIDFETKSNENVERIGQELLSKVAKQEQMKKDSIIAQINPFSRPSPPSNSPPQEFIIKSSEGDNISELVSTLVDTALLKYSKDILGKPDYALGTSGARVVPSLTSSTYEVKPIGIAPKVLGWLTGTGSSLGRPPVTALHPYNSPGYCWPFSGSRGQIGILLSRIVIPEEIILEHVSKDVAVEGDVSSAPKDFEVWGVVEGKEDIDRLKEFRLEQLKEKRKKVNEEVLIEGGGNEIEEEEEKEEEEPASSLPLSPSHILLAIGSYDITSNSPIQTFPVTTTARQLGIPVGLVIVKILSNHGESHYTCLYRVRVSGTSLVESNRERMEKGEE